MKESKYNIGHWGSFSILKLTSLRGLTYIKFSLMHNSFLQV